MLTVLSSGKTSLWASSNETLIQCHVGWRVSGKETSPHPWEMGARQPLPAGLLLNLSSICHCW